VSSSPSFAAPACALAERGCALRILLQCARVVFGVLLLFLLLVFCCRPYGVASLLAVHDKEAGPQLYLVEPSGELLRRGICTPSTGTRMGEGAWQVFACLSAPALPHAHAESFSVLARVRVKYPAR
jgi:hypothetical protein